MPKLVSHDGRVIDDSWQLVDGEPDSPEALPGGKVIVPLAFWLAHRDVLKERLPELGVWLRGDEDPSQLGEDAARLPLIAVNFPVFTDGRGFSTGRLLRERYRFGGELRAIGHYLRDQLCYLRRCGFSAFSLPEKYQPEAAAASLSDFTEYYQAAVDQPLPLFRRRG